MAERSLRPLSVGWFDPQRCDGRRSCARPYLPGARNDHRSTVQARWAWSQLLRHARRSV